MLDLIAKKREGGTHSPEELEFVARAAAGGSVPDYQLSAWLMAVLLNGMAEKETVALTRAMASSGERLSRDASRSTAARVDKHSTGGVGDGVSLALAPLVAAGGLIVPMMSGRGLGHTGGTLDKLESIKGFRVRLSQDEISAQLRSLGVAMFGQSERLAPADRKLYQLRDATATVPSQPLIVGSILSKKAAEDLDALVLDVKVGSGAIFKTAAEAEKLAKALVRTSNGLGIKTVALLTAMEQPLGRCVGNALEIKEAARALYGDRSSADYVECLLALGGWMLHLGGKAKTPEKGSALCEKLIASGAAVARFKEMIAAQGGDPAVIEDPALLPRAAASKDFIASRSGFVTRLDARAVGQAGVLLGAGRATMDDELDYGAGIELEKKIGDRVEKGERIARLSAANDARLDSAMPVFASAVTVADRRKKPGPTVIKLIK